MDQELRVKHVAVVGSGSSALGALWALGHSQHRVYLYEAEDRLGGHANAVCFRNECNGKSCMVDTAFMMVNDTTYPNFTAALDELHIVRTHALNSISVSRDFGDFEWASSSVFAQWSNFVRPSFWRMLFDIVRFNTFATDVLLPDSEGSMESIGDYLEREKYSKQFRTDYLLPVTASVWANDVEQCRQEFPVGSLIRFMWNHRLLNTFRDGLSWSMIKGSSSTYIDALVRCYPPHEIHTSTPVQSLGEDKNGMWLKTSSGKKYFDHVILTTSAEDALTIMSNSVSEEDSDILGCFKTDKNIVVLHSDMSFMPKRRTAWAAYNYMTLPSQKLDEDEERISVTCWMNCLQGLSIETYGPIFVTINPLRQPMGEQGRWMYKHPVYTAECIKGQQRLSKIQNKRSISYAGAWTKFGFHEDGFSSGLRAAKHIDPNLPIEIIDSALSRGQPPARGIRDHFMRTAIRFIQSVLNMWDAMIVR